jgi:hypothetical protein
MQVEDDLGHPDTVKFLPALGPQILAHLLEVEMEDPHGTNLVPLGAGWGGVLHKVRAR